MTEKYVYDILQQGSHKEEKMKKNYIKPMVNASMNGTLEGVFATSSVQCSGGYPSIPQRPSNPTGSGESNQPVTGGGGCWPTWPWYGGCH